MNYDKAAELGKTDLFRAVHKRALRRLAEGAVVLQHPAGSVIADEGERGISLYLILEGTAGVSVNGEDRSDLGPGDYFGEIAVLDGKPRTATVTAKTDLTTLAIGIWNLQPIFLTEPPVMTAMVQVLCHRLRVIEARGIDAQRIALPDADEIARPREGETAPTA